MIGSQMIPDTSLTVPQHVGGMLTSVAATTAVRMHVKDAGRGVGPRSSGLILLQKSIQLYNPSTSHTRPEWWVVEPLQLYSPLQPSTALYSYTAIHRSTVYSLYNTPQGHGSQNHAH